MADAIDDPNGGLEQELDQLDMENSTVSTGQPLQVRAASPLYSDYDAASNRRLQVLRFLGEELFGDETEFDVKLHAVKNCHLLIDEECCIGQTDILTLLQQVLESEIDVRVVRGIPFCLNAPIFQLDNSPHVEQLLEKLCCFDDNLVRKYTVQLTKQRKWLTIPLVERVIQLSHTYHGKVSACQLTAATLLALYQNSTDVESVKENVEHLLQVYLNLCQDPIPMVRCAAVREFKDVAVVADSFPDEDKKYSQVLSVVSRSWILDDKDPEVRTLASQYCLFKLDRAEIIMGLKNGHFSWSVSENIAAQLDTIIPTLGENTTAIQQLAVLFFHKYARVRLAAVQHVRFFAERCSVVPLASWIHCYKDADTKVKLAIIKKTPSLIALFKQHPENYQNVRDALYFTLVYDEDPLVRATAIDVLFQECLPHMSLSPNEIEFFYESTIAYEGSWRPLNAAIKNIPVALKYHPQQFITKVWTAAISNHVDILRNTAMEQIDPLAKSLGVIWVQEHLLPILSETARTTRRHMVKNKCLEAIAQIEYYAK